MHVSLRDTPCGLRPLSACALTYLVLPRRELSLGSNEITSLAGVTFRSCKRPLPDKLPSVSRRCSRHCGMCVVACALTYLVLTRRYLTLSNNAITSLAGVTFPASMG
jgi:hypothetical protein